MKCEVCSTNLIPVQVWLFRGKKVCSECYNSECDKVVEMGRDVRNIPVGIIKKVGQIIPPEPADFDIMYKSNDDGRHDMSNKLLDTLKPVMYAQDNFGMDKYGVPLKHHLQYDWLAMFFEEQADGLKYIQAEMQRRIHVRGLLTDAIEMQNWKLVEAALHQLAITGTGTHKKKTSN